MNRRAPFGRAYEMSGDRAAAYRGLMEEVRDALDRGDRVPCVINPEAWLSDDPEAHQYAIQQCLRCPVLDQCQKYAITHPEAAGVWGATHPPKGEAA